MFDRHSYPKGARILSMLLYVVGEDSFFRGIQRYLERNAFRSVESSEFRVAMEEATGKSLGWFFDQWVYSGGHPEFHVSYEWDDQLRSVALHVKQQQVLDDATTLFRTPVEIEITTAAGRSLHRVEVSQREEHFTFPCPARPRLVRFDKQDWILKELVFPRSREELIYQLEEDDAAIGRLQAAVELGAFKADSEVRTALLRRALAEPFWGVRLEIVKALKEFVFDDVRVGLIDAYKKEPKAPVRAEILRSLAFFSGADVTALLRTAAEDDASYFAVAEALRGLAKLEGSDAVETLLRACDRASHGDVIRISALESLGLLAEKGKLSSAAAERIVERLLALSGKSHPVSVRGGAFLALARIGRIDRSAKSSQAAYERLVAALDDSYVYARMAAYRALGELGETRAVPLLKARAEKETHRPFRDPKDAVDEAIRRIESQQGEGGVQEEIGRIRRAQEEFERRLDRLEKR
jgi:aminopeptidase N